MNPNIKQDWTFLGALMDALKKPEESTAMFAVQIKALTEQDKEWYKAVGLVHHNRNTFPMSDKGQKATSRSVQAMSAIPSKTDMRKNIGPRFALGQSQTSTEIPLPALGSG
jgi:hypothetical protein